MRNCACVDVTRHTSDESHVTSSVQSWSGNGSVTFCFTAHRRVYYTDIDYVKVITSEVQTIVSKLLKKYIICYNESVYIFQLKYKSELSDNNKAAFRYNLFLNSWNRACCDRVKTLITSSLDERRDSYYRIMFEEVRV